MLHVNSEPEEDRRWLRLPVLLPAKGPSFTAIEPLVTVSTAPRNSASGAKESHGWTDAVGVVVPV